MDLPDLDPAIHQRTRLRVMTLLFENRQAASAWVRKVLELTPGNLDSHTSKLEEAGYVERGRVLTGDGFEVRLRITPAGDEAFRSYLEALKIYTGKEPLEGSADGPSGERSPG